MSSSNSTGRKINCNSCSQPLPEGAKFCMGCGQKVMACCSSCGKELPDDAKFCMGCGTAVAVTKKAKVTVLGYCAGSGKPIRSNDAYFKCLECGKLYLETQRFEDKPICQQCAYESGVALAVESICAEQVRNGSDQRAKEKVHVVCLPKLDSSMSSAKIIQWISIGAWKEPGDIFCEVETDKVTLEMECTDSGYITPAVACGNREINVGEIIAFRTQSAIRISMVLMCQLSPTMETGKLVRWLGGEVVKKGDILCEVETDKATMELECMDSGYFMPLVSTGAVLKIGSLLGIITDHLIDIDSFSSTKKL